MLAGLSLYTPCRRSAVAAQHLLWVLVAGGGRFGLPGRRSGWLPPTGWEVWSELWERWCRELGDLDGVAVYQRRLPWLDAFSVLLLHRGRPVAFLKVRRDHRQLDVARQALAALVDADVMRVPTVMATGAAQGWAWLALAPMPAWPHRPARHAPLSRITGVIQQRLDGVLDRTACPGHWRPMHGDFTPWNLRTVGLRQLWLLDWDDAGWGPPDADLAYYEATNASVRGSRPAPASPESVAFWLERLSRRAMDHDDVVPFEALRAVLRSMSD
jgi:hypothetical protein